MEFLFQLFDDLEDVILTAAFRLRRSLARMPRERRRVVRLPENMAKLSTTSDQ
jgi:hypothetical protein